MFDLRRVASAKQLDLLVSECLGDVAAARFWTAWRDNYITHEDIHLIKKLGLNSVRVPINWRLFVSEGLPHRLEGDGWRLLDRVVGWCREEHLWVVIDLHAAPDGQTGDNIDDSRGRPLLFEDPEAQDLTVALWTEIARRYQGEPTVLGYDLLNEPIAPYFDTVHFNARLAPLYGRLIAAVRTVDTRHVIILGGAQWDVEMATAGLYPDRNLLYTFHRYWLPPTTPTIQPFLDFRRNHHVPIWLGESGESDDAWVGQFRRLLEADQIGWCFWPYKKLSNHACLVTVRAPKDWHYIDDYASRAHGTFEDIRKSLPGLDVAQRAFAELLENVSLSHSQLNDGYVAALGLNGNAPSPKSP